jgi:hypothetical protein
MRGSGLAARQADIYNYDVPTGRGGEPMQVPDKVRKRLKHFGSCFLFSPGPDQPAYS